MSYATSLPAATTGQGNVPVSASYYFPYQYCPHKHGNERGGCRFDSSIKWHEVRHHITNLARSRPNLLVGWLHFCETLKPPTLKGLSYRRWRSSLFFFQASHPLHWKLWRPLLTASPGICSQYVKIAQHPPHHSGGAMRWDRSFAMHVASSSSFTVHLGLYPSKRT